MFSRVSVDAIEINQYGEKVTLTKLHCICEFLDSLGICFIPSSETEISMNFVDFNLFI